MTIDLGQIDGSNSERKHFGFTVSGGKDKNAPLKIDAVIVGTPADEAGLQVRSFPTIFSLFVCVSVCLTDNTFLDKL